MHTARKYLRTGNGLFVLFREVSTCSWSCQLVQFRVLHAHAYYTLTCYTYSTPTKHAPAETHPTPPNRPDAGRPHRSTHTWCDSSAPNAARPNTNARPQCAPTLCHPSSPSGSGTAPAGIRRSRAVRRSVWSPHRWRPRANSSPDWPSCECSRAHSSRWAVASESCCASFSTC